MKDSSRLDLLAAFLGTLGALLLLLAAFAAAAQGNPDTTDRLIVRLADWADGDRAQPMSADRARSLSTAAPRGPRSTSFITPDISSSSPPDRR